MPVRSAPGPECRNAASSSRAALTTSLQNVFLRLTIQNICAVKETQDFKYVPGQDSVPLESCVYIRRN